MYSCQEEYDYHMRAAAEAEAEAMAAQAEAEAQEEIEFEKHLSSLIDKKKYDLYALEVVIAILSTHDFKTSGISALEYLTIKRNRILKVLNPAPDSSCSNEDKIELPF